MTTATAIETQEDLQVRVNESLVELDNLITALKFLKEEAETSKITVAQAVENLLLSNSTLIQDAVFTYLRRYSGIYNAVYNYLESNGGAALNQTVYEYLQTDNGAAINRSVETFIMNSSSFYDRFYRWFKRYQLNNMAEKVRQEVETEINNHLEQFIYASLDSRIEMVLARKKANATS
jgi:hypothetical protein